MPRAKPAKDKNQLRPSAFPLFRKAGEGEGNFIACRRVLMRRFMICATGSVSLSGFARQANALYRIVNPLGGER